MPDIRTFTGGCHCGLVRFECTTDLAMVTACNCSICTKKGLHFSFLAPKDFALRAGEDNLKDYLFNKHAIRHQLCSNCGVDVFARGSAQVGRWALDHGFLLTPDAPEVLDFYSRRSPVFMAAKFDARRAQELGQGSGDSTPIMATIPTDSPPMRARQVMMVRAQRGLRSSHSP